MENFEKNAGGETNSFDAGGNEENVSGVRRENTEERKSYFWLKAIAGFYLVSMLLGLIYVVRMPKVKVPGQKEVARFVTSMRTKNGVGVVEVFGPIYQRSSRSVWIIGETRNIANQIRKLADKKEVKAVLLDINSPGGTVSSIQDIYATILRVKKKTKKPFVARIGDVAASGGYYIAAACDKIISNPGSITGSIGVIFQAANYEGLMKKIGLEAETIKSGKYKDIGSPVREMTSDERELLQKMIDDAYAQFLDAVSKGRNIPGEKLKNDIADGRIYTGRQAMEVGLVDEMGDFQVALNAAGKMAKLGANPRIIKHTDPIDEFFSLFNAKTDFFEDIEAKYLRGPALLYLWEGF